MAPWDSYAELLDKFYVIGSSFFAYPSSLLVKVDMSQQITGIMMNYP